MVLIASAEDLPLGAAVTPAHRQDATFTAEALAAMVVKPPLEESVWSDLRPAGDALGNHNEDWLDRHRRVEPHERKGDGRLSRPAIGMLKEQLEQGQDVRALPYLRGDGSFAKIPALADAKREGFRLWAPAPGQSRRGLGIVRSAVERAHALLNQFGRVLRRLDRNDKNYLGWVQFACCIIFMRRGFFP